MSKAAFAPCELDFLYLGKDIIATSGGEDAFGTKDEDFDIFGNMTGGEQQ